MYCLGKVLSSIPEVIYFWFFEVFKKIIIILFQINQLLIHFKVTIFLGVSNAKKDKNIS